MSSVFLSISIWGFIQPRQILLHLSLTASTRSVLLIWLVPPVPECGASQMLRLCKWGEDLCAHSCAVWSAMLRTCCKLLVDLILTDVSLWHKSNSEAQQTCLHRGYVRTLCADPHGLHWVTHMYPLLTPVWSLDQNVAQKKRKKRSYF